MTATETDNSCTTDTDSTSNNSSSFDTQEKNDEFMASLTLEISQNIVEPSTPFIMKLDRVFSLPKDLIINNLRQLQNPLVNTFREQMFFHFLANFDESTLSENGFIITEDDAKVHLKRRTNILNAIFDIYDLGLSVHENQIVTKLASKIFKTTNSYDINKMDNTQLTLDNTSILQKLQDILEHNSKLVTQNLELKKHLIEIEKDNNCLKEHILQIEAKLDTYFKISTDRPSPIPTPNDIDRSIKALNPQPNVADWPIESVRPQPSSQDAIGNQKHTDDISFQRDETAIVNASHTKKENPKKLVVYGGKASTGKNISGATRPYSLFVGGFDLRLTEEEAGDIISHDIGIQVINIFSNRRNDYNQSFRVDIDVTDKHKAFESDRWYRGLVVKPFRQSTGGTQTSKTGSEGGNRGYSFHEMHYKHKNQRNQNQHYHNPQNTRSDRNYQNHQNTRSNRNPFDHDHSHTYSNNRNIDSYDNSRE